MFFLHFSASHSGNAVSLPLPFPLCVSTRVRAPARLLALLDALLRETDLAQQGEFAVGQVQALEVAGHDLVHRLLGDLLRHRLRLRQLLDLCLELLKLCKRDFLVRNGSSTAQSSSATASSDAWAWR